MTDAISCRVWHDRFRRAMWDGQAILRIVLIVVSLVGLKLTSR